jgi:(S)-3,5-dihydroxyphenylglycine transaminase
VPTLKALDTSEQVVYLGSLAKTALPGVRIGYAVADQPVVGGGLFADELAKLKSMLTVNTSAVAQAVAGGKLLEHDCSLVAANQRERAVYVANLRQLTDGLSKRFSSTPGVSWTVPSGGYFVVVNVPFAVDDAALELSARDFGVLWTPMSHFYDHDAEVRALRLSCSAVTPDQIELGLDRLAAFVSSR